MLLVGCAANALRGSAEQSRRDGTLTDDWSAGEVPAPALVRSCPVRVAAQPVSLEVHARVGEVRGYTWLFGYRDRARVLARLGADGALRTLEIPHGAEQLAADARGVTLLMVRAASEGGPAFARVELDDVDAPATGPEVRVDLDDGPVHRWPRAMGAAGDLAVVLTRTLLDGDQGTHRVELWDRVRGARLATSADLGRELTPVRAWCGRVGCVLVVAGGGSTTHALRAFRLERGGAVSERTIADDTLGAVASEEARNRVYLAAGGSTYVLDRRGERLAGPERVAAHEHGRVSLLRAGERVLFAERALQGREWSVRALDAQGRAASPALALADTREHFLIGAPMPEGAALVSIQSDVDYAAVGDAMMHSWTARASAGFVGDAGAGLAWSDARALFSAAGEGRGGVTPWVLVAPGRAAVLLESSGDANEPERLVPLRAPCP